MVLSTRQEVKEMFYHGYNNYMVRFCASLTN